MTGYAFNLLTQPLIHSAPSGPVTLPGLLARLACDEVDAFPALRPHQGPAWHMFLVQLAALALHGAGRANIPEREEDWLRLLRDLASGFSDDEPWCLVVDDWAKPAFLQPPVPNGLRLTSSASTPDALDLLNTAKNHDLKQAVGRRAEEQDWLFALVSLQTGGTFSKAGSARNYWSAVRTGNIYAPRLLLGLAPLPSAGDTRMAPSPGAWFRRDVAALLETRDRQLESCAIEYSRSRGIGLTWLARWPEGEQLQLKELDIWFIEACRRVRLQRRDCALFSFMTGAARSRINDLDLGGKLRDPWTPEHKTGRALRLSDNGYHYTTLSKVLFGERKKGADSHDWDLPVLLKPAPSEQGEGTMLLVAQGIIGVRQKSGTQGFKSRALPIGGKVSHALTLGSRREALHRLAQDQMAEIGHFDRALRKGLSLAAAGGNSEKVRTEKVRTDYYVLTKPARALFDRAVDDIFFEHLWARFEAQDKGEDANKAEKESFARALFARAEEAFEASLPAIPCPSIFRPRAEARARLAFRGELRGPFPELFKTVKAEETEHAAA